MKRSNVLVIGAGLLLAASSPVFADGDGDGDGSGSAAVGAGAEVSAGGASAGASGEVAVGASGSVMSDELIAAPLTLPKSVLGVSGAFDILKINFPPIPPATMGTSTTAEFLFVGAGYGVSDKLEVGATYGIDIHDGGGTFPSDGRYKGPLGLYGGFSLATGKITAAAGADFTINLGNTDSKAIHAGLGVRYMVAPKIAIYSGNIVTPGPVGQHLSISLASKGPITFGLPVGVAIQAAPKAYVWVATNLATFSISNSSNVFIFKDAIPLDAGLLYRVAPALDLGVGFQDNLKAAGDSYVIGVLARWVKH